MFKNWAELHTKNNSRYKYTTIAISLLHCTINNLIEILHETFIRALEK